MKYTTHLIKALIIFLMMPIISVFNLLCVVSLIFYDIIISIMDFNYYSLYLNFHKIIF